MNKTILIGRLTRDPDVRYTTLQDGTQNAMARYTLAVDRRIARRDEENAQTADFISCVMFGRQAEFAEKYLQQGTKIAITGHIQTGSYTNRNGAKVYTTDVVVETQEFAESKALQESSTTPAPQHSSTQIEKPAPDGFMNIPQGVEEDDLPW